MSEQTFAKTLSANDLGETGSHQAGIHVPKTNKDLLLFFPHMDSLMCNPDVWIVAEDETGREWKLRYVYYNNRLHSPTGTRNEYRLTHVRGYLHSVRAKVGDLLIFSRAQSSFRYRISLRKQTLVENGLVVLQGWSRVH